MSGCILRNTACVLVLAAGCVKAPPAPLPPSSGRAIYEVAVAAASGNRTVIAVYRLEMAPAGGDVWTVRTLHTEGTVEEAGESWTFDSDEPRVDDPWPLSLQHAVASVPAAVTFDRSGAPVAMVEQEGWREAGRAAMAALDLPDQALRAGESLLDPEGLVRDLQRNFPGRPAAEEWVREESIAGLPSRRVEQCERVDEGARSRWTCAGEVEGPTEGPARLHEVETSSIVVADRVGLVSMEGSYAGTLVMLDETGNDIVDSPVAGRRLVVRR